MKFLVCSLMADIIATFVAIALGYDVAATILGYLGPLCIMFCAVAWIVFVESRKRWSNTTAVDRFANVITFKK